MTRKQKLSISLPLIGLLAFAIAFLTMRSGHSAASAAPVASIAIVSAAATEAAPLVTVLAPALTADPILEIDTATLTTYLAGTTGGQLIKPGVDFRGVDLDGRLRKGSSLGMHVAGNPIGPFAPGTQSVGGVTLMNGAVTQEDVDLAFPADGPRWVIGRTYNARQDGGSTVSNGFQGKNWFQTAQPEIQLVSNRVYLFYGADRFIEFKLVTGSSTTYRATNGAAGAIEVVPPDAEADWSAETWVYTDQAGWEWTFLGFDDVTGTAAGQIWKIEAPSGEVAYVGDPDLNNDPVTLGYVDGKIALAFDSEDRRYTFTYTTLDSVDRLTEVEVDTKTGRHMGGQSSGCRDHWSRRVFLLQHRELR